MSPLGVEHSEAYDRPYFPPLEPSRQGMLSTAMLKNLKKEKPWAVLKVSRREYETVKPWTRAGISRALFEELILGLPDGFVDHCHMEADAEKLVEALFGKD